MRLTSTEPREIWQRAEAEWGGQGALWDQFQAKEGRGKRGGLHEIIQKRNDGFCVCCGHRSPWACPWIGKGRYGRSQKSTRWKKKTEYDFLSLGREERTPGKKSKCLFWTWKIQEPMRYLRAYIKDLTPELREEVKLANVNSIWYLIWEWMLIPKTEVPRIHFFFIKFFKFNFYFIYIGV